MTIQCDMCNSPKRFKTGAQLLEHYRRAHGVKYGKNEHGEQHALFQFTDTIANTGRYPGLGLMYANPNWRPKEGERIHLAEEGVKTGVPDIFLPVARGIFHGLFIEMKEGKNKPTKDQKWYLDQLGKQGYMTVVAYGFEQAWDTIVYYYGLRS